MSHAAQKEFEFFIAGFGGQGVLLVGQLMAKAAMAQGQNVSWIPSYGAEMRGGEATCSVIISTEPIGSPIVTEPPVAIIMNQPSLAKFEPIIKSGGILLYNASLINTRPTRSDIKALPIPCNQIADELGNSRVANMVMLGAIIQATGVITIESAMDALKITFGERKADLLAINKMAMERGMEAARKEM